MLDLFPLGLARPRRACPYHSEIWLARYLWGSLAGSLDFTLLLPVVVVAE